MPRRLLFSRSDLFFNHDFFFLAVATVAAFVAPAGGLLLVRLDAVIDSPVALIDGSDAGIQGGDALALRLLRGIKPIGALLEYTIAFNQGHALCLNGGFFFIRFSGRGFGRQAGDQARKYFALGGDGGGVRANLIVRLADFGLFRLHRSLIALESFLFLQDFL
ncbi:MAG: hypothetical protein ABIZ64_05825, partial [Casimicrobium sp.]